MGKFSVFLSGDDSSVWFFKGVRNVRVLLTGEGSLDTVGCRCPTGYEIGVVSIFVKTL